MKPWKAELALLSVTFLWGGTFLFTKIGLDDCTPSTFIILRFMLALSLSLIFFGKSLTSISPETIKQGIILGLLFGGGFILQTYGLKYTTVSKSAFITGMTVPITPFVFKLIQKTSINFWSKVGVVVATMGLYIFTRPDFDNINPGDLLTLMSTFFWAFYITYMDKFTKGSTEKNKTHQLVFLQFLAALPPAIITLLAIELPTFSFNLTPSLITALAYNGILASFLVTIIHTSVQRYTTPVKAALIFSLEPIVANVLAIIVINEILNSREYSGAAILFSGLLISELGPYLQKLIKKRRFR
ncbi:MAG: DMT family transporter [Candidatus Kapabacteria bacterium]|nr:DMT family transporter [Ignavibacteriota bacterium]MCW5883455.1 DMT family transporter [Candidatus Kapabacteria bacterium]